VVVLAMDTGVTVSHPAHTYYLDLHDDVEDLEHIPTLVQMADYLVKAMDQGSRIAVFCREGRNRSGLLVALTLCRLRGWTGGRAMRHIQSRREDALTNEQFAEFLSTYNTRRRVQSVA